MQSAEPVATSASPAPGPRPPHRWRSRPALVTAGIVVVTATVLAVTVPDGGGRRTNATQAQTAADPAPSTTVAATTTTGTEAGPSSGETAKPTPASALESEVYLGTGTEGVRYSGLDSESRLRVDGLGPVRIGMNLDEAAAASGVAMRYREGPYCVGYATEGPPAGLFLISVEGSSKVDFISVSEPSIATLSGIRVGSSLVEVRRAYGDRLRGSLQDGWGKLVIRPDDPSLDHLSLALLFSEGKVAGMWAGLRGVVEADEACA